MRASADQAHMTAALRLAERGLGDTWPNPTVGCVLVKDGYVVGRGVTHSGGRPHAEQVALERAGAAAKGATAYVTLEPCSHQGKTPPCAHALINAGVARVVVGATDPDPRVLGNGIKLLRMAGVQVVERGPWEAEAVRLNAGFFRAVSDKRPLICLKTATGLDGRIAMASGESQWITGPAARRAVHMLRARYDGILVGSETALADDPDLTCRMDGYTGRPKVRVVLDRRLRLPAASRLATTAKDIPTWVITAPQNASGGNDLRALGVDVIVAPGENDAVFMEAALQVLAQRGLTRLLVEGGGQVAAALLNANLVDELAWFRAGKIMGAAARPAVGALMTDKLASVPVFQPAYGLSFGSDRLDMFVRP
jgi:diaminohydroxyphosphoribosylaminopyrimidine deaminase/5-amino-6-(5-phosphoribosylamino)uracil reductase